MTGKDQQQYESIIRWLIAVIVAEGVLILYLMNIVINGKQSKLVHL